MPTTSPVPTLALLVVLSLLPTVCPADKIVVSPDYLDANCSIPVPRESNATRFNEALGNYNSTSDIILMLDKPGCFVLKDFALVKNVVNYTIQGSGPSDDFVILCQDGVGLAFVASRELTLQNLTIFGCGMRGQNTDEVREELLMSVSLFFHIPNDVNYGVFLGDCSDVNVSDVTVTKTSGIGLVAINVIGNSSLNNLQLTENQSPVCFFTNTTNSFDAIGGGMYVLYQDYKNSPLSIGTPNLTISNAYIYNNSYCSSFTGIAALYDQSKTARSLGYTIGGGGGMGVSLAQLGYKVNITVNDAVFLNNTGWSNAGVYVGIFEGVGGSYLNFTRCQFVNNGYEDYMLKSIGLTTLAAAFLFFNDINFPNVTTKHLCDSEYYNSSAWLTISESTFSGNTAYSCGAIESYSSRSPLVSESNQNQFRILNCTFTDNKAVNGPVFCLLSVEYSAIYSSLNVMLTNVRMTNNSIMQLYTNSVYVVQQSALVVLSSSRLGISGNCNFEDNMGSVAALLNSILYLQGNITFENNQAMVGGAVQVLSNSYIVIENESNVTFARNSAYTYGGAIYFSASQASLQTSLYCFLYFGSVDPLCNYSLSCPPVQDMTITVSFIDNNATVGGAVYGSTLNSCPWFYTLKNNRSLAGWNSSALQLLAKLSLFYFSPPANDSSVISTLPTTIEIRNSSSGILATPGQTVNLEVVAYDAFAFRVCSTLSSASDNTKLVQPRLGDSGFFFITDTNVNGTLTPVIVVGMEASEGVEMALYSTESYVQAVINISLDSCGFGFQYNLQSLSCECIPEMVEAGVNCNVSSYQLEVKDGFWLGPGPSNSVVYTRCYYDYCVPGSKTFYPSEIESQCNSRYNRIGYVCGSCKEGESALLGTSRCKECSNLGLVWIPALAVVGIVAIFAISLLDVTITQGYVNGFLFYCNCINYFIVYLAPEYPWDMAFIPLQWVNLALGIESCFYNGMTPLVQVGLRFVFPVYLFLLMAILVLLSRWFNLMNRLHFSSSKTFATLLLLCYINISGTCLEILGLAKLEGLCQNLTYYGWLQDPGVRYGEGWHGFLVFVAGLLMVVYVLPMPLLLLFPQFFYSFRFTKRFMPMYDAFWSPFQLQFRFWLGLRALLRLVPFILALYVPHPYNVFAFAVFIATLFFVQERLSPFRSYWRNALDGFFLANLFLMILGNVFYERFRDQDLHYPLSYVIMLNILLGMAYVAFMVILVIHAFLRFPKLHKIVSMGTQWSKRKILCKEINLLSTNTWSKTNVKENASNEEIDPLIPRERVVNFSEFREPLLDDEGTVSLVTRSETR